MEGDLHNGVSGPIRRGRELVVEDFPRGQLSRLYIDLVAKLCAQPSVSATGEGVEECAQLMGEVLAEWRRAAVDGGRDRGDRGDRYELGAPPPVPGAPRGALPSGAS